MGTLDGRIWKDGGGQGQRETEGKSKNDGLGSDEQGGDGTLVLDIWLAFCVPRVLQTSQLVHKHFGFLARGYPF